MNLKKVKYLFQLCLVSIILEAFLFQILEAIYWFGVFTFLGITRLQRWERAKEYGLYPPEEVKEIILKHPDDTAFTEW